MHLLLWLVVPVILFIAGIRFGWMLLVGKPKPKGFAVPEKFVATRGKKGDDGIYQLTEAQVNLLTNAAQKGLMFMAHLPKEGDDPKSKQAMDDQNLSFGDLEAEGLLQGVPEKEYTKEIKQSIKGLSGRSVFVKRLTDHGYAMFSKNLKEVN